MEKTKSILSKLKQTEKTQGNMDYYILEGKFSNRDLNDLTKDIVDQIRSWSSDKDKSIAAHWITELTTEERSKLTVLLADFAFLRQAPQDILFKALITLNIVSVILSRVILTEPDKMLLDYSIPIKDTEEAQKEAKKLVEILIAIQHDSNYQRAEFLLLSEN